MFLHKQKYSLRSLLYDWIPAFAGMTRHRAVVLILFVFLLYVPTSFATNGTLDLEVAHYQGAIPKNGVAIPFLKLKLSAIHEDVIVEEIQIRRQGLSSYQDFGRVWASINYRKRSYNTSFLHNDLATIKFRKPLLIAKDETIPVTIYANMRGNLGIGKTSHFFLEKINTTAQAKIYSYKTEQLRSLAKKATKKNFRVQCKNQRCVKMEL